MTVFSADRLLFRCAGVALLVGGTIRHAAAGGNGTDPSEQWVERGIELRRARNDAEALEYFRRAYEIRPTPRTRVQMALAEQALGHWVEAEGDLVEALKAQGDNWIDRNRDKLLVGLETIREHLAWLRIDSQQGAELWINGARVGTLPLDAVRVVATTTWVELRTTGSEPWQQSIDVHPAETVRVVAPLLSSRPAPQSPAPSTVTLGSAPRVSPQRIVGWVSLGVGGLLLAEGVAAEIVRANAAAQYNDDNLCLAPGLTREQMCGNYRGRAETARTFATAGWVGGGAAVSAGLLLLLTSRSGPAQGAFVHIGPREAALSWQGTF